MSKFSALMAESEEDSYIWMDDPGPVSNKSRDKKRRFSEEQVKSLELMFESQTKLEPRKKLQLAKDLGLHPRQVAIWFQNKRARWKSKQLEREYSNLKADYDALVSNFESLKNEKQALTKQLHKLAELLNKPAEVRGKEDEKPGSDIRVMMGSDDEEINRYSTRLIREKQADLYAEEVPVEEQQFCFQPSWPSDQITGSTTSQWWDFWPLNG